MWPIAIALSVLGGLLRANAAKRAAQAQAAQDEYNAALAERAAGDAVQRGQFKEGIARLGTSEKIASDQSQYAHAGVDTSSGSPADVAASQRGRGELAARIIQNDAFREALGYRMQGKNFRARAAYARSSGDQAYTSELLGGGLRAAGMAAPIIRIGEPTTFEGDGPYAGMDLGAEDVPAMLGET